VEISARLWVLNLSDVRRSLLDIADRSVSRSRQSAMRQSYCAKVNCSASAHNPIQMIRKCDFSPISSEQVPMVYPAKLVPLWLLR
jgi:hypothetical protein